MRLVASLAISLAASASAATIELAGDHSEVVFGPSASPGSFRLSASCAAEAPSFKWVNPLMRQICPRVKRVA